MRFKGFRHYSPIVMAIAGGIGVVTTAILAAKATPKAINAIEMDSRYEHFGDGNAYTPKEAFKSAWRYYIPTAISGLATIACIAGSSILSNKNQAAVTSAYILLDRSYKTYKEKVNERFGEDADRQIQSDIIKAKYNPNELSQKGEVLTFYEEHYGKMFERSMLEVLDAEYRLNRKFILNGEANLNDFFELLGLPKNDIGGKIGWSLEASCSVYGYSWLDFVYELVKMDDGMECYIINIPAVSTLGYDDLL